MSKTKSKIKGTEIVEKRNILNEVRRTSMTLQELRFFSIYLAKINARDINTRRVRFKLSDFQKIMGFNQINIVQLKESTNSLLSKVVNVPDGKGGYTGFTLFKRCKVFEENFDWYIEIEASDDALPLMFDFKSHYFTYELWNALQLKSSNQIRMYEILKQYEYIGKREIAVSELRELLGIAPNEYPRWERFRTKVLDSCQKALAENTDICFTYEKGKSGTGGKWITIVFHIKKNENYVDRLSLKDFIDLQTEPQIIEGTATEISKSEPQEQQPKLQPQSKQQFIDEDEDDEEDDDWRNPFIDLYRSACNNEFSELETSLLVSYIDKKQLPDDVNGVPCAIYNYLGQKYLELKYISQYNPIKNRFKYLCKMIKSDFKE